MPGAEPIVLSDTVGFIRDLPHDLVAAFRATLAEAADADLLLHVVDGSAPDRDEQIAAVEAVLGRDRRGRGAAASASCNKIDLTALSARRRARRLWYDCRRSLERLDRRRLRRICALALAERFPAGARHAPDDGRGCATASTDLTFRLSPLRSRPNSIVRYANSVSQSMSLNDPQWGKRGGGGRAARPISTRSGATSTAA